MENSFEEPEISFHEMSNVASFLEVSDTCSGAAVTPGFDEQLAPPAVLPPLLEESLSSAVLEPLSEESLFSHAPTATSTPARKLCPVCGAFVLKKNFARHYKGHCDISFHCKECCQYFDTQNNLDAHNQQRHSRREICSYCGHLYKQKSALNEHMRIKHEKTAKMVTCNICNKEFHRVGHLHDHMNTHYKRTPYKCQKCKRVYHSAASLKRHTKDCSETVTLKCQICTRTFSSANTLADHIKSEHTGKRYTCECGNSYKWRSGLARHRKGCPHVKSS